MQMCPKDKKTEVEITHENHRRRIEERFLKTGFLGWSEYEILEYLLYAVYKRRDTSDIAHELIMHFGNLKNVLAADKKALIAISGVGNEAARYLTSLSEFMKYINVYSEHAPVYFSLDSEDTKRYIKNLFFEEKFECLYMICLDSKNRIIKTEKLSSGTIHHTNVEISRITARAMGCGAAKTVFAHNHPSGIKEISSDDRRTTIWLANAMIVCGVEMLEHIIVADNDLIFARHLMQKEEEERMGKASAKIYKTKK